MHVDSPATIIQTVEARGGMSIGFQSVEARVLAPKGWLTGLGFTWAPFFEDVAKSVMAGQFAASAVYRGLGKMVAVAPFGAAVPADVRKAGHGGRGPRQGRLQPLHRPHHRQHRARSRSRPARAGAATRWATSTGTSKASSER